MIVSAFVLLMLPATTCQWPRPPHDPAYARAQQFAGFLREHQIAVSCITGSTIASSFLESKESAGFQTSIGSIHVAFLPEPDGAERVKTEITYSKNQYHYRFHEGWSSQKIDGDSPLRFLVHGSWFIFVFEDQTEKGLRAAFAGQRCP